MWRGLTPVTPQSADLAPSPHLQQVGEANWVDIYSLWLGLPLIEL